MTPYVDLKHTKSYFLHKSDGIGKEYKIVHQYQWFDIKMWLVLWKKSSQQFLINRPAYIEMSIFYRKITGCDIFKLILEAMSSSSHKCILCNGSGILVHIPYFTVLHGSYSQAWSQFQDFPGQLKANYQGISLCEAVQESQWAKNVYDRPPSNYYSQSFTQERGSSPNSMIH